MARICTVFDAMWSLPSALNVKVKKPNQAWVNGGYNHDPREIDKYLVI